MKYRLLPSLSLMALTLSVGACDRLKPKTTDSDAGGEVVETTAGQSEATCGPAGVSEAPQDQLCPPQRRVGHFAGACPKPYGEEPVPAGDHWEVASLAASPASPLAGYCRYMFTGAEPTPLPAAIDSQLGPDCRVYAQSPLAPGMRPHYQRAFADGTQPISAQSLPGGAPVELMVVDTAPDRTKEGVAAHGPAIAAIAADLAGGCVTGMGEGSCARRVHTTLGLPQTVAGPSPDTGGYYGYQSELAEGIAAAIDTWAAADKVDDIDHKLIINLSVGWEPTPNELADPSPVVQGIRDLVGYARCRGGLVVAASGNQPQGTCLSQATAPGAWAAQPGLDAAACSGLGVENAVFGPGPSPLVYAATPLDWSGDNLTNFRPGSNARFAATGFAGFDDDCGGRSFGPMTGSSVSTAVVSGVAALVWSYHPSLKADELMELLYASGRQAITGHDVDLDLPGQVGSEQHQITACAAMREACSRASVPACAGALAGCPPQGPVAVDAQAWSAGFDAALASLGPDQRGTKAGPEWTALECEGCGGDPRYVKLPQGTQTEPEMAWVLPQPQKSPCPFCKIKTADNALQVSLDPDYARYTIQTLSVYLYDATGASEVLHYSGAVLPAFDATTVQTLTDPEFATVDGATATGAASSGQPPVQAYVELHFDDGGRAVRAGNQISVD